MSTKTPPSKEQIRELVTRYVDRHQPADYRLVVKDVWFSDGLGDWIASVDSDREDVNGVEFGNRLAEIQEEIEQDAGMTVFVHPPMWRED